LSRTPGALTVIGALRRYRSARHFGCSMDSVIRTHFFSAHQPLLQRSRYTINGTDAMSGETLYKRLRAPLSVRVQNGGL